ncbi:MAG: ROK family protein [Flavobacteriaceae bacterium]|nr:ROK family protein [Flavobacteriaceae bacterium]
MNPSGNKKLIGVDLGGTKVVAGLVEEANILKQEYSLIPNTSKNKQDIIDTIIKVIDSVYNKNVAGIGIGIPSLVDRHKGIVYSVQNIPSWKKVHLKEILENHYKIPVYLDNDANCFALGEYKFGTGKGDENFVGITLGTGIGSGIISKGHLLNDTNCGSGEFGSIPYLEGIYEDYCSGKFFKTHYNQTGEEVFKQAKKGNPEALKAYEEFGFHLGNTIKTIMFSVDPKKIIIGGSIANSKEFFAESMLKSIKSFPYEESVNNLEIKFTNTANIAILGAASLYYDRTA